ncbi:Altered inheritance of mitochondria protein 24, mitochondrial [Recurvomyces mirabilis]|nr:Altered inheritance of mitochondria protein 24, mitochondrial [Recurvomyces mirabilis]
MSFAHWGNTTVTGRGLVALSGRGQSHQITLKTKEKYVVHPSHILAYNLTQHAPGPYRFKSTSLRFQVPALSRWIPDTKFWRTMREATAWRWASSVAFTIRTWARRTIWGDRLFLEFTGPATIYIQSRGSGLRDVLTDRDVNEIADSPAGSAASSVAMIESGQKAGDVSTTGMTKPKSATSMSYATVNQGGTVKFDEQKA